MYISVHGAVVKMSNDGKTLAVFNTSPLSLGSVQSSAITTTGSLIVVDQDNARAVQFDVNSGNVLYIYNTTSTNMDDVNGIAIEPSTNNIYLSNSNHNQVIVFAPYQRPTCTTGASAGNYDLSELSPDGSDLLGVDATRSFQYVWSVCGNITDADCRRDAPAAAVCGLAIPVNNGFTVAQSIPTASWTTFLSNSSTGVTAAVMNGKACGKYGLPSVLVISLFCASTQDKIFQMDDSQAFPDSSVCTYVLTLNTPVVCRTPITALQ